VKSLKRKVHRRRNNAKGPVLVEKLPVIVNTLHDIVVADPGRSVRSIATKMGISKRADCEEDSAGGYSVEVLRHETQKVYVRGDQGPAAEKAKTLLARIKHPSEPYQLVFLSDEKNFTQD
jgi:hypothetical protein